VQWGWERSTNKKKGSAKNWRGEGRRLAWTRTPTTNGRETSAWGGATSSKQMKKKAWENRNAKGYEGKPGGGKKERRKRLA